MKRIALLISSLILGAMAQAEPSAEVSEQSLRYVFSITTGVDVAKVGQSQDYHGQARDYVYHANNSAKLSTVFGGFAGAEYQFHPSWAWQFGMGFYYALPFNANGTSHEGSGDQVNTYNYRYQVQSSQLVAENKLLATVGNRFHPYVSVGLGMAFNKSSAFESTPVNKVNAKSPAMYADHSNTAFMYSLGVGLEIDITKNWRASTGYRYSNLGQTSLGSGTQQFHPLPFSLTQSNLSSHEILLQLTFLF